MTEQEMKRAVKLGKKLFTVYPMIEASLYGVYALQYFENTLTLIYTDNSRESCSGDLQAYRIFSESASKACEFVQGKARVSLKAIIERQDKGESLTPEQTAYAQKIGLSSVCNPA